MRITLKDQATVETNTLQKSVPIELGTDLHSLYIMPEGYGDFCSTPGNGCPVLVEVFDGKLRVVVWGDINQEDPTHIIDLEGAREDKREPGT